MYVRAGRDRRQEVELRSIDPIENRDFTRVRANVYALRATVLIIARLINKIEERFESAV